MATLDDVLSGPELEETEPATAGTAAPEQAQQVEEGEGAQPQPDAETTAANSTEKHVPLAALEAERKGRQDWKEKAIRLEEEAKQLRERMQAQPTQQPAEQRQMDPMQQIREEMLNHRFNTSEMLARQRHADLDDVMVHFREAAQKNPALGLQLLNEADPYGFAYREGKKAKAFKDIGEDPDAYRARLEAEILAQLQQTQPEASAAALAAAAKPALPTSLAGARSSASRMAPAFTGPAPLDTILQR